MLARQVSHKAQSNHLSRSTTQNTFSSLGRQYATKKAKKSFKKGVRLSDPINIPGLEKGKDFEFDTKDPTFRRLMHLGYITRNSGKVISQGHDTKKFQNLFEAYDKTQLADDLLSDVHRTLPKIQMAAKLKKKDIKRLLSQEAQRLGKKDTPLLASLNRDLEEIQKREKKATKLAKNVSLDILESVAEEPHDRYNEEALCKRAKRISPEWFALFDDPYRKEEQEALMLKFRDWITNSSFGMKEEQRIFASWLVHVKGRSDVIAKVMKLNLYIKHRLSNSQNWDTQLMEEYFALPDDFEELYSPLPPDFDEVADVTEPQAAEQKLLFTFTEEFPNFCDVAGKQYGYETFAYHLAEVYENIRDTFREHKREKQHALRRTGRVEPSRVLHSVPETYDRTALKIRDGFGALTPQIEKSMPNDVLVSMEKLEKPENLAENSLTGFGRDSHADAFPVTPQYHKDFESMPIFGDEEYFEDEEDVMHWTEGMHLYPFELYTVENRSVTNITAKGRVNSNTVLVIFGNYHGTCGWGYGKGTSEGMAMTNARSDAIRNLISAPMYVSGIPHPVKASFSSATVELYPSNRISAEPFLARVCELFGLDGVRVRTSGRRNKRNLLRAFFKAIMELRDDYDIAVGRGLQLPTDIKRFYHETANAQYKRGINMYN